MPKPQILRAIIISAFLHLLIASAKGTNDAPQEYVEAHNAVRHRKGVPPLQWDEKLADFAQRWAHERINDCNPRNHSGGQYGENTLWMKYDEYTPTRITQVWVNEEKNYDDKSYHCNCKPDEHKCVCGHYTQLIWSTTKRLGCGSVTCNNELGYLVVCSYDPPGNYQNENPFQNPHHDAIHPPPQHPSDAATTPPSPESAEAPPPPPLLPEAQPLPLPLSPPSSPETPSQPPSHGKGRSETPPTMTPNQKRWMERHPAPPPTTPTPNQQRSPKKHSKSHRGGHGKGKKGHRHPAPPVHV